VHWDVSILRLLGMYSCYDRLPGSTMRPGSSGHSMLRARAYDEIIQQVAIGWGKEHCPASGPLSGGAHWIDSRCNVNGSVTELPAHIADSASRDARESVLPVIVLARAALTQVIARQAVVDVAALDVTRARALGVDMWVCASGANVEVTVVDVVTTSEAVTWLVRAMSRCAPLCLNWILKSHA
jgi:hypothetical protein